MQASIKTMKNLKKEFCSTILNVDPSIRFVGRLCSCGRLQSYIRKQGIVPLLNLEETKIVYHKATLKAKMNNVFDSKLGQTHWSVESRDRVKWITIYMPRDLLLISTDASSNHDAVIRKVFSSMHAMKCQF